MKSFAAAGAGRVVVLHLGKGELLLESIAEQCRRLQIKDGVVLSCIGSLRRAVMHVILDTAADPADRFITLERPMELGVVQGLILDAQPHLHLVFSDLDRVYTGHLEPGTQVQYLCEIAVMELRGLHVTRKTDRYGVQFLDTPGEKEKTDPSER